MPTQNKVSPVESLKMAENIRKMFSYANGARCCVLLPSPGASLDSPPPRSCSLHSPFCYCSGMPLEAPVVYERSDVQASPRFVRRQRRNSRSIPTSPALPDAANHSASPEHIATPTPIADDHQHDTKAGDATPMPGAAAALAPSLSSASPGLFLATTKVAENDSAPHSKARGGHSSANPPRASSLASQLRQTRAKLRQVSPGAQQRPHSKGHTLLARLVEHSLLERFRFARGDDSCTTSPTPSAVARSVSSSLWPSPVSERRAAR